MVAHNYVEFAKWLGIINKNRHFLSPNWNSAVFDAIKDVDNFYLNREEKIGFFLTILRKGEVWSLLLNLKSTNRVRDFVNAKLFKEHFAETFFDWFVDLDILVTDRKRKRPPIFLLSKAGSSILSTSNKSKEKEDIEIAYCSSIFGSEIQLDKESANYPFKSAFSYSMRKLGRLSASKIAKNLYAAYPILLYMRMYLMKERNLYLSMEDTIDLMEKNSLV